MAEQDRAATSRGFDKAREHVEPRAFAGKARFVHFTQTRAGTGEIFGTPQHHRDRRIAVATRASGFLVIAFDRFGSAAWATKRTSGLSMPMPNATVATMIMSSEATNAA
jgi:hypothetical protein